MRLSKRQMWLLTGAAVVLAAIGLALTITRFVDELQDIVGY